MLKHTLKIQEGAPTFNKYIIESMAYSEMRDKSLSYIDSFMSSIMQGMEPVTYHGIEEMTVDEEVASNINPTLKSKKQFDVSVTYKRKFKLLFSYGGEAINGVYIYLPFVEDKGIIISSGIRYHVIPVITDPVITVNEYYVFIRLLRDKLFINNDLYSIEKNGEIVYNGIYHSERLYKNNKVAGKIGNVLSPIDTYILTEYGFFNMFPDKEVLLVYNDPDKAESLHDTHDIYTSTGKPPANRNLDGLGVNKLAICVEKGGLTPIEFNIITSCIYIFDVFPAMAADFVDIAGSEEEPTLWKHIISRLVFRDSIDTAAAIEAIDTHFLGLRNYLDPIVDAKLKESNIMVDNFIGLLRYISDNSTRMKLEHQKKGDSVRNKYVDVLYYIYYPLIVSLNNLTSKLNSLQRKDTMTKQAVEAAITDNIRPRCIFNSFKTKQMSLAIMPMSTSIDWAGGSITNAQELQARGTGVIRNTSHTKFPTEVRTINAYDIYAGSMLHFPKDWPTPLARMNGFARYNEETRAIDPDEDQIEALDILARLLKGKIDTDTHGKMAIHLTD